MGGLALANHTHLKTNNKLLHCTLHKQNNKSTGKASRQMTGGICPHILKLSSRQRRGSTLAAWLLQQNRNTYWTRGQMDLWASMDATDKGNTLVPPNNEPHFLRQTYCLHNYVDSINVQFNITSNLHHAKTLCKCWHINTNSCTTCILHTKFHILDIINK